MRSSLIKLHIAVFLWGFTGVLGRLINLNEGLLVWYRLLITITALLIIAIKQKAFQVLSFKQILHLFIVGTIIALHWVCFYGSIKASNVSVCLTCLSSAGLFTAFLEPFMLRTPFKLSEIMLSLLGIAGICLIFHFDTKFRNGILIGMLATLLSVIFSIFNKKIVVDIAPKTIMLYELLGGFLVLTLLMPFYLHYFPTSHLFPSKLDWVWLTIMSLVCTVLAMDLSLQALKKMSVFTQNLALNLEPVYGIILAFVIYKENDDLSISFYLGFALIASSVAFQMYSMLKKKSLNGST